MIYIWIKKKPNRQVSILILELIFDKKGTSYFFYVYSSFIFQFSLAYEAWDIDSFTRLLIAQFFH